MTGNDAAHDIRRLIPRFDHLKWKMAAAGIVIGLVSGLLVVVYRLGIEYGTDASRWIYARIRETPWLIAPWAVAAVAAALAIAGMYFLRCLHPPGGAVALTAILGGAGVHSEGYHFVLTPVLLNSLMLALLAIVFNNLVGRRYPHPLAAEEVKSRAVPLGISVTREDIHAALLEGQFLDIDEDDVQELLENIEQQARQRIATAARR